MISTAHSPSYVVSMGEDGKLCVWERFHGHLINSIHLVSNIIASTQDYYRGGGSAVARDRNSVQHVRRKVVYIETDNFSKVNE